MQTLESRTIARENTSLHIENSVLLKQLELLKVDYIEMSKSFLEMQKSAENLKEINCFLIDRLEQLANDNSRLVTKKIDLENDLANLNDKYDSSFQILDKEEIITIDFEAQRNRLNKNIAFALNQIGYSVKGAAL